MKFEIDTSKEIILLVKDLWKNNFSYIKLGYLREQIFLDGVDSFLSKMDGGLRPVIKKTHGRKSQIGFVK